MQELIIIGAAAAAGGALIGAISGAIFADRRLRRQYEEVRTEISRLRSVAEDKLSGDDPDIDKLLNNLGSAVESAYRALEAMENQAKITKRKSEGGKEVVASSRYIIRMIDELAGRDPEPYVVVEQKPANKILAPTKKTKP